MSRRTSVAGGAGVQQRHAGGEQQQQHAPLKQRLCPPRLSTLNIVDETLEDLYFRWGKYVASHTCTVTLATLALIVLSTLGLLFVTTESDPLTLWVPDDAPGIVDRDYHNEVFGIERNEQLLFLADDEGANMLTVERLGAAMTYHNELMDEVLTSHDVAYTYGDICVEEYPGGPCKLLTIMALFNYNPALLASDEVILDQVNSAVAAGYNVSIVLGGIQTNATTGRIEAAAALLNQYYLQDSALFGESHPVLNWEAYFIDQFKSGGGDTAASLHLYGYSERTLEDEANRAMMEDMNLLVLCAIVMGGYVCLALGEFHLVRSRILLGIASVMCVVLSLAAAFGMASYFGVKFVAVNIAVMFLCLGVGLDDTFLIVSTLDRTAESLPLPERIARTLRAIAPSITMTSMTSITAFFINGLSRLPGIQNFSTYSGFSIMWDFGLQVSLFVCFLVFDTRRRKSNRMDVVPCVRPSKSTYQLLNVRTADEERRVKPSVRVIQAYSRFLTRPAVKAAVVLLFALGFGVGLYGVTGLNQGLRAEDTVPYDSYLTDFYDRALTYFGGNALIGTYITQTFDYTDPLNQQAMLATMDAIGDSEWVQDLSPPVISWYTAFLSYLTADPTLNATLVNGLPVADDFYPYLDDFLASGQGMTFANDIVFIDGDPASGIEATQSMYFHHPFVTNSEEEDGKNAMRAIVAASYTVRDGDGNAVEVSIPQIVYNEFYLLFDSYEVIIPETVLTLGMAMLAISVITFVFLASFTAAFLTMAMIAMTNVATFALMAAWEVPLNGVSVTCLVMGIGMTVDYSAHITHAFMNVVGSADERAMYAVRTMGPSVINGCASTYLGVVVLSFGSTDIYVVFFRMFTGLLLFGLAHGIVLLPVLLTLIGPRPYPHAHKHAVSRKAGEGIFASDGGSTTDVSAQTSPDVSPYHSIGIGIGVGGMASSSLSSLSSPGRPKKPTPVSGSSDSSGVDGPLVADGAEAQAADLALSGGDEWTYTEENSLDYGEL